MNVVLKFIKKHKNACLFLLAVVAVYVAMNYYSDKFSLNSYSNVENNAPTMSSQPQPAQPLGQNSSVGNANGMATDSYGLPPSCAKQEVVDPKDLLPKDANSEFSKLNPAGSGDLQNVNLLKSGHHIGINTVGQSLRNANLQLRSEPANPQVNTGPWNKSTITGDTTRRGLEMGH
jgi:hypothetical protein